MFENIIGNEKIKKELLNANDLGKILHSYMFIGTEGIGKKIIATEFAKMILCTGEKKYCGNCKSCIELDSDNNPDFEIIEPDGNSIKIEQIRKMQEKIYERPVVSDKKVYIIDDADKMTVEAQNCLLKTLEEPPRNVVLMLIGQNENLFLTTIKSRCMIMMFEKISNEDLQKYLRDNYEVEKLSLDILNLFQGSIKKAINLKDKQEEYKQIKEIFENIDRYKKVEVLTKMDIIYISKDEIFEILDYINVILMENVRDNANYANCIKIVEQAKMRIIKNANYDMTIDNMLLKIWEVMN